MQPLGFCLPLGTIDFSFGIFFGFEISPLRVVYTETRRSFVHWITSVCAIVGGVATVAGIVDALIYRAERVVQQKIELGKQR